VLQRTAQPTAAQQVVDFVHELIAAGTCRPGDRLPPERELAGRIGVSRPSVRAGLQALAAMGVVETRHGAGTFISDGAPLLGSTQLHLLATLHGFSDGELFEVRRVLEVDVAGLAAERATADHLAVISEEVMEMFASRDDPMNFLVHDIRFHRAIAHASGNPVLAALVDMVAELFYQQRKDTVERWKGADVASEHHRRIYQAIRDHDRARARREMDVHLTWAEEVQRREVEENGKDHS
jgi:GntR family transcriptional repressor for pyruvate dehydrogenase complex